MSNNIQTGWNSFLSGFFGSFKLAAAIVMAVVSVSAAFVNSGTDAPAHHKDKASRI